MSFIKKWLLFFETSFLIASHVFFLPMTMSAFAAYLIGLIATFIVGSIALVITARNARVVPVVRKVELVSVVVRRAPTRVRRR